MAEKLYHGATAIVYMQETTTSQLDSVSDSADTTQPWSAQNVEIRISNTPTQYLTCDGNFKYLEGPLKISLKIEQLVARAEVFSALIGADSLTSTTYTVTRYSQFLPRLTIHLKLEIGSNEMNINLTDAIITDGVIRCGVKETVMMNVEIVAEGTGTLNWEKDA